MFGTSISALMYIFWLGNYLGYFLQKWTIFFKIFWSPPVQAPACKGQTIGFRPFLSDEEKKFYKIGT